MNLHDIEKLPPVALNDLAYCMVRDERKTKTPIHLGAVLSRIKSKETYLIAGQPRFSLFCRKVLKITPRSSEEAYVVLFRRCQKFDMTEREINLFEGTASLQSLCIMTRVAISKEELFSFLRLRRTDGKYDFGRIRLLGEERKGATAPTLPLSTLRFTTKQAEIIDFTLQYFRDQFDLSGAQTITALCSLALVMRSTQYGERTTEFRKRLAAAEVPSWIAGHICPP